MQSNVCRMCEELTAEEETESGGVEPREPHHKRQKFSDQHNDSPESRPSLSKTMNVLAASSSDDELKTPEKNSTMEMVLKYHKEKRIALSDDISETLQWWKLNYTNYPVLAKLARRFLACPPSSVASKQFFIGAGIIYDEKRNRLKGKTADKLLFHKNNLARSRFDY